MKKIIIRILAIAIIFAGCTKDLDLSPQDTITDAAFWKTPDDFKLAANNLYSCLAELNFGDTESDIAFNVNNSISNGSYQTSETSDEWNNAYIYIRRCNNLIEKAAASAIYDEIKKYEAEALFFRAYNYWRLLRLFGGVPKITKVLDLDSPELYQQKADRGEIADLIISDLTLAAAYLPISTELEPADVGRITKSAADALRSRVALFEGTWIKFRDGENAGKYLDIAIEASATVMSSGQHTLYTGNGASSYRYLFIEEGDDTEETILDRRYQKDIAGQVQPALIQRIGYLPTKKMADMYLCTDGLPVNKSSLFQGYNTQVSEYQDRDPRMTMTMMLPGSTTKQPSYASGVQSWPFYPQRNPNTGYMLYKYMSENVFANSQGESPNFSFDNHIIRYAEVLLIYAEARFEKDGAISDADLNTSINLLRQRAGMVELTNAFVASNNLDMRNEIRRERTVELAFENFRYDDLRRWKTAETEMPMAIKGIKVKGSNWTDPIVIQGSNRNPYAATSWQENTDADGFIIAESANGRSFDQLKHYLRPIPTKEILLNPNLEQNPGW
jgi:hypothetical protein